jgi:CHRD domain
VVNRKRYHLAVAIATAGILGVGGVAIAHDGRSGFEADLTSYEEVPALSTNGVGSFHAQLNGARDALTYELTFSNLTSNVLQSHIHFENATNNGPVIVFLCTNLGNGPAGTPACPAAGGTVTGTITAASVLAGGAAQGIAAGDFDALIRALDSGATYVNVHSVNFPGGEIRAQLDDHHAHGD